MSDALVAELHEARRRFLELVADIRPELHRYCARMVGSIADGEDLVQDALARAYFALAELETLPPLRPWLFRIAQNRALDHLRGRDRRAVDIDLDAVPDSAPEPEEALAREQAVGAAVSRFLELPPAPRSCVILKDVLGHSLDEIGALLELSLPAVKAALHRGRVRLRELGAAAAPPPPASPVVARYADLFNARDWDGVRAMLAEDVRLDLVSRSQRSGRRDVGIYFTNYGKAQGWRLVPAWLDGREVLAVLGDSPYFVELTVAGDEIAAIRDYRHVPYIGRDAAFVLAP